MNELQSGWTYSMVYGAAYHFEHVPLTEALEKQEASDQLHVVETTNGTFAKGSKQKQIHQNKYFALSLTRAIGLATRIVISSLDCPETVIAIRPATEEEKALWLAVDSYFTDKDEEAFSDQETDNLLKQYRRDNHAR